MFPSEVENVICQHPAVMDAAVVGVPHEKWGESVCAVVIRKPGAECSEEEVVQHCRRHLAGYKRPKRVVFIEPGQMPRTATGKILHRILRERLADGDWP